MDIINFVELPADEQNLLKSALLAREFSYSPFSKFKVGASVLDDKGNIFSGCNIESADFTLTTHAEMCAVDKMVSSGSLIISKVAIVFFDSGKPVVPCGLCRQKISEFAGKNVIIIGGTLNAEEKIYKSYRYSLDELLPFSFNSNYFKI